MRSFEEWEGHFAAYRKLLRQKKRADNPNKTCFHIEKLWTWLRDNDILPNELEPAHYARFSRELEDGELCKAVERYAAATIADFKGQALCWTRHLAARGLIIRDPFEEFLPGHPGRSIRGRALSVEEVKEVLDCPDIDCPLGMRDQAVFEVAYGSGLRLGELARLQLESVELSERTVNLKDTKNGWDRCSPLTEKACRSVIRYLSKGRPELWGQRAGSALWVNVRGEPFTKSGIAALPARYRERLGFRFSMHDLRFTCATHLLEGGARLPDIAKLLGHECLTSTQIYTRARVEELRRVHSSAHPRG